MPEQTNTALFFATFGRAGSPERDRSNAVFDRIVCDVAEHHGLRAVRADRSPEPGNLTAQTFRALMSSRVVICDLTYASPNVFYELGVVHACNIPVVLLRESTNSLPFYVRGERVIETGDQSTEEPGPAKDALSDALEVVLAPTYVPTSLVGQVLGLTGPFPAPLRQAIHSASLPLYRERMKYDLHVRDVDRDHLTMEFKVNYRLVNRTETSYQQTVGVVPMRPFQPIYGEIAGDELDVNHPDYLTERGWQVPHNFEAGSVTEVAFVVNVTYRMPDADIFATYLPATDFELKIRFPPEKVRVVAECLLPATVRRQELARGAYVYRPPGAVLAYGGFRLDWLIPNADH